MSNEWLLYALASDEQKQNMRDNLPVAALVAVMIVAGVLIAQCVGG